MARRAPTGFYYCNTPIHETDDAVELLASAARTAGGTGTEVASDLIENARALQFVLNISVATVPTSLDVEIQAKIGNLWYELAQFVRQTNTNILVATVKRGVGGMATALVAATDPAVAGTAQVNNENAEWGSTLRVKWAQAGTSWTFSVTAYPIR